MINFEAKKVLFIDLDSTLIKTISGKTFPEDITDFRIQLPVLNKVIEKFPNLGNRVAMVEVKNSIRVGLTLIVLVFNIKYYEHTNILYYICYNQCNYMWNINIP